MADGRSLTWTGNPFPVLAMGCGCAPFAALLAVALAKWSPVPTVWCVAAAAICVALAMMSGRYDVHTVVITARQIRLESSARTTVRDVAELRAVEVVHSGNTQDGYDRTDLRLLWSSEPERHGITGPHDPQLASSVTRLRRTSSRR
ncbi:hypothetical protein [Streptomyces sp. NBC_00588]|uniref:hypothetical protein n=1 Tax=Streptomyces sp. NBC_00588 TaxID=2975784 RepID=UPI002E81C978|nr:hypothetical protein [Streptomyces sp. NBC_00588]WUB36685.1 hypothetical protein OHN38_17880 [Streptomyces sp. NBC_00588]